MQTAASFGFLNQPGGKGFAVGGPAVKDAEFIGTSVDIGVRKGHRDMVDAFNCAFAELAGKSTYQKLLKKYFKVDLAVD